MKFVFYVSAVSLTAWKNFASFLEIIFAKNGDLVKMNILEILSPKSVGPIGSEMLRNVPKPLAKL